MSYLKQLVFIIPAIIFFVLFLINIKTILLNPYWVLDLSGGGISQVILSSFYLLLSSTFTVITFSFINDWKLALLPIIALSILPLIFIPNNFIILLGFLISTSLTFYLVSKKLKSYLDFQPIKILNPSITQLTGFLLITLSINFYFIHQEIIRSKGLVISDSLVETVSNFSPVENIMSTDNPATQGIQNITPSQIAQLKQNPDLLRAQGLDPSILDEVERLQKEAALKKVKPTKEESSKLFIKAALSSQLNKMVEPIKDYLPLILAALFFFTIKSFVALLGVLLPLLTWGIFSILDKTGFTKYQVEQRPVKKLII